MVSKEYLQSIRKCKKCRYSVTYNTHLCLCLYWEIMGHRRPCPPGEVCTVFEKRETRPNRGGQS